VLDAGFIDQLAGSLINDVYKFSLEIVSQKAKHHYVDMPNSTKS
jgi:hypothetical protein